ncbi:uncharacterized protein [Rhodnius prolixus]|uniref:uncharacterized protein n=1 Tax=Rhodnius prolixus TaxID=13249 RepID=UPI003D18A742
MDFAGPFTIRISDSRKALTVKVYLCIFVCFSTKAVHLELASDLSTSEFLDVLQRFISRRGCPAHLYSDCGTNFVGASTALTRALQSLQAELQFSKLINDFCFSKSISFHFNPPSAPHQGGLWERAVQSAKYHLNGLIASYIPTYKVLNTLVIRIEGILNSRPLSTISSDPNDFSAVTPAHFLLGRSLIEPPDADAAIQRCSPRQLHWIQTVIKDFWTRWKSEYLPALAPRGKWTSTSPNLSVGDLVLIDADNTPPSCWPLARVLQVFPGSDGIVRRARLKTATSELTRPAVKLFRLPIYD